MRTSLDSSLRHQPTLQLSPMVCLSECMGAQPDLPQGIGACIRSCLVWLPHRTAWCSTDGLSLDCLRSSALSPVPFPVAESLSTGFRRSCSWLVSLFAGKMQEYNDRGWMLAGDSLLHLMQFSIRCRNLASKPAQHQNPAREPPQGSWCPCHLFKAGSGHQAACSPRQIPQCLLASSE